MKKTPHSQFLDLIPAYALGGLDDEESAQVARHLESCAACRRERAAYEQVVDSLALAVPVLSPPPHLQLRLQGQIRQQMPAPSLRQQLHTRLASRADRPRWQPLLALVALLLLVGAMLLWQQNNVPVAQFNLVPTDAAPGARGRLAAAAAGSPRLTVTDLPLLPADRQYQLWLVQDGERESGAVFSVNENGAARVPVTAVHPLDTYQAFGITIEPAGGSPGPTGDKVLGTPPN